MKQVFWTFAALVSHWRRHPANLATLLLGLAVATALWSGVQALNVQARKNYDDAAAVFPAAACKILSPRAGNFFRRNSS